MSFYLMLRYLLLMLSVIILLAMQLSEAYPLLLQILCLCHTRE